MSDRIEVGDECIIIMSALPSHPIGTEVTILQRCGPPGAADEFLIDEYYELNWDEHSAQRVRTLAAAVCLVKKRPPTSPADRPTDEPIEELV